MVGEQDNGGSVTTGTSSSACTGVLMPLGQLEGEADLSQPEQEQFPGPSTPTISSKDEVIIETSDGGLFLLSRCRLAAESLFFRALFHGTYMESTSSRVRLTCICSSDFRACLSLTAHIYSGTTPQYSVEAAMNLMVSASFLQMSLLMEELVKTIASHVHPSNRLAAYRKATMRSAVLARKLWNSIIKEFRLHISNSDYEKMTESEILAALIDEHLDIESRDEEPLINNWIARNPKNHERMLRLKSEALQRRGTDGRLNAVIRDRVPREVVLAIGPLANLTIPISWVAITNMHDRRCYVAATAFLNPSGMHHVVAMGGYNGYRRLQTAEILNIEKNHWFHLPFMSKQRSDAGAVVLAGRPTIIGGFDGRTIHNDIEMLDFASQSWFVLCSNLNMKLPRLF
uniref:BTB domain-containing protein n=1 Tax=Angiostrongylus cantonensis TaxID=6313 RepID=A0A158PAF4_ANGCA